MSLINGLNRMCLTLILRIWNTLIRNCSSLPYKLLRIQIRKTKVVGILSREGASSYGFLQDFLTSSRRVVGEVRPFIITNNGQREFCAEVQRCDVAILYHSKKRGRVNITDVTDCLYTQELDYLHRILGKSKVIVVADDLDSSSTLEKQRILQDQPQIQQMAQDLFLFSEEEKQESARDHMNEKLQDILSIINQAFYIDIGSQKAEEILILNRMCLTLILRIWNTLIRNCSSLPYKLLRIQIRKTKVVGILSREGASSYGFLQDFLTSSRRVVGEVRPFIITNNGQREFCAEVQRCDVAILYHSKKRGRVNITDVTDCLYTQELDYLHRILGKSKVIVVADDLDSSSTLEKQRILQDQPQIQQMAQDLFLFSEEEKQESARDHMNEKLQDILSIINQAFYIDIGSQKAEEILILNRMCLTLILRIWNTLIRNCSSLPYKLLRIQIRKTKVVGILSREGASSYGFLQDFLTSSRRVVGEVRPFIITNNGQREFCAEVQRCDVAILYHSKKRGRVNITDVTDCLYTQELDYLHRILGKSKVIVVADDLDSSSTLEKQRILQDQPQIQQMAQDLFLFSEEEKQESARDHMNEKLQDILSIINQAFYIDIGSQKAEEILILTPLAVFILQFIFCGLKKTDFWKRFTI